MKILMIGRGVIATMYGWALAKAGHTVEYYVRPGRAAQYGPTVHLDLLDARTRLQGVRITETLNTHLVEDLSADHDYDLIVVSVQHYRFAEVVAFLAQRVGPTQQVGLAQRVGRATVLMFTNLWTDPQETVFALSADQVVWGFPSAGGGFGPGGVLTGGLLKNVVFGQIGPQFEAVQSEAGPTQRELAVRELFRSSGFGIQVRRDFRGWLLLHFLTNVGLLSQALRAGSVAQMMASDAHLRQAVLNVRELLPILAARGVDLRLHGADAALFRLPPQLVAVILRLVARLNAPARLGIQAGVAGDDLEREVRPMTSEVLLEARRLGIAVPRLEAFEELFLEELSSNKQSSTPPVKTLG